MEQLQNAGLNVYWSEDNVEAIPVQYNPNQLKFQKSAQIGEISIPGLDSPLLQFVRGGSETLMVELFFDTTDQGMGTGATSVTTRTDRIYELVKIVPERHAPPVVDFFWNASFPGADVSTHIGNQRRNHFRGLVEKVDQTFTLFSPEGVPLRAQVNLTMREYKTLDEQLHQLNLTSPDRTHSHVVQAGETLSAIAGRLYRRPAEWRAIARENGIHDPRRLAPGTFLTIPPIRNERRR